MPKKTFRVRCAWQEMGDYIIKADNEEEARVIAEDASLPKKSSFVAGSFEIDSVEEIKINGPREPIPEAVVDDLRDALSEILEEVGLKIPVSLRDRGIKACQAHERYL